MDGIEPSTYGLRNRCSTTELHRRSRARHGTYAIDRGGVNCERRRTGRGGCRRVERGELRCGLHRRGRVLAAAPPGEPAARKEPLRRRGQKVAAAQVRGIRPIDVPTFVIAQLAGAAAAMALFSWLLPQSISREIPTLPPDARPTERLGSPADTRRARGTRPRTGSWRTRRCSGARSGPTIRSDTPGRSATGRCAAPCAAGASSASSSARSRRFRSAACGNGGRERGSRQGGQWAPFLLTRAALRYDA